MPNILNTIAITALSAVQVAAQADDVEALARRLRTEKLTPDAFEATADALLECGPAGARALAAHVSDAGQSHAKELDRARHRLLDRFEQIARKLAKAKSQQRTKEIAADRAIVLRYARNAELTETEILANSDPALGRLRGSLTVHPNDVFDDDDVAADRAAFDAVLEDVQPLAEAWQRAAERLTFGDELDPSIARFPPPPRPAEVRERLDVDFAYRAILAIPMSSGDARVFEKNRETVESLRAEEAAGILALNEIRVILGLNALVADLKLSNACRDHSKDMVKLEFFSHTSPVPGKTTPGQRAALAGTSGSAENIAQGHDTGPGAVDGWWHSPGHHRNMLGSHSRVGLGQYESTWTQLFGG